MLLLAADSTFSCVESFFFASLSLILHLLSLRFSNFPHLTYQQAQDEIWSWEITFLWVCLRHKNIYLIDLYDHFINYYTNASLIVTISAIFQWIKCFNHMILWFIYHLTTACCGAISCLQYINPLPICALWQWIWGCKWGVLGFMRTLIFRKQIQLIRHFL